MKSFIVLNILVSVVVVNVGGQSTEDWTDWECCPWKMVGMKKYRLVGQSDEAWDYGCSSDCTYKTEGSDVKYCFKPGGLESECYWDEGGSKPPMTGSPGSRPPTTPGNRPLTTGGPRPPTTEGNRPPTTTMTGGNTGNSGGCKCGVEKTSRIVGGSVVDPKNKYPWMVALVSADGLQFC